MKAISTILVPFDFSDVASNVLQYTLAFLENDPQVKILLVHVEDGMDNEDRTIEPEKEALEYGYSNADEKNENAIVYYLENFYSHHSFVKDTDILKGVFGYVEKNEVDLIAMFPRNHEEGPLHSKGKLTRDLSQHTKVPFLAIDL